MQLPTFESFYGVDFSGGRLAGRNAWVARCELVNPGSDAGGKRHTPGITAGAHHEGRLRLLSLDRLESLAGTAERIPALAHLVQLVRSSTAALWGCDFPFGLPIELFPHGTPWADQFAFLAEWEDDAYGCGLECVRRATELLQRKHIMRASDREARTPFDCYHYRIIYQTFFGIRDVIGPLSRTPRTAVLPFQYRKLSTAERVVVECCPSSVLKGLSLPHQNYKQPTDGPLSRKRRFTRHAILEWLAGEVRIDDRHRRVMMRNPGGDAIDAVIAAVGAARAVAAADHRAISRHPRYRLEGHLFF